MNLSPAWAGFIKGLLIVVIAAVATFFADSANLSGIVGPSIAAVVAAVASAVESSMKAKSGGTTALFGAAHLK